MSNHLTESLLGNLLSEIYDEVPVRNKAFPGHRFRPDFRYDENKIVVEFDGYQHYSMSNKVLNDRKRNVIMEECDYKVIRIPYFIQLDDKTSIKLFGMTTNTKYDYPHGFISDVAMLPADFCSIGVERFINDLVVFDHAEEDIRKSLKNHLENKEPLEIVPPSLMYLLE